MDVVWIEKPTILEYRDNKVVDIDMPQKGLHCLIALYCVAKSLRPDLVPLGTEAHLD